MRAFVYLIALLSVLGLQASDSLPTLDQVIEQHIRALGGRTALARHGMLVLSGDCESTAPGESGPVEISIQTPKVYFDLKSTDKELQMGFNGDVVWRHAQEGLQKGAGREFADRLIVFDVARALWWKEWYPQMALKGIEKVGDSDAYVLETHPGSPSTERVFVDRRSGLRVLDVTPGAVFNFSNYRAVDGVQVPFTIEQKTRADITYTYKIHEAKWVTADASRFEPR
jgi:hypothetical protein